MLVWTPVGGKWSPKNIGNVHNYGLELFGNWKKNWGDNNFNINASYAYTNSEDQETGKQLIYVPFHKANANASYSYKKITATYQFLFNGEVFTPSQKFNIVEEYTVSNFGLDYNFGNKNKFQIGLQALNILNESYQSVSLRPMPGRNYALNLNFKF